MKLLFTGASGFLGINVKPLLERLFEVQTVGLTNKDNYQCDLVKEVPILNESFDIVLHAAGKAHSVPKTEEKKRVFFDVNYQGTVNLCHGLEKAGLPKSFIFVSTVAVYGCDFGENITEEHSLDGDTPYALSKIQAENFLREWCALNGVKLSIIRPSLLAGPNPPGNLGTMIKGISSGRYLSIAGGKSRKSILMVQDIANLVPLLINREGVFNICDSEHPTFRQLERLIATQLKKSVPINIPYGVAKFMALMGNCIGGAAPINSLKLKKITESLTFSNRKAVEELGWQPMSVLENFKINP